MSSGDESIQLLARWKAGDEAAATEIFDRYVQRLAGLARSRLSEKLRRRVDAEDVVQEAFVRALERLADLRDPSAFLGWFRQIVRRQCYRVLRRTRGGPAEEMADIPGGDSPDERVLREERRRAVREALHGLPRACRQAAEMFYLEERDCPDIGSELGVPVSTVRRRLYDARKRLREFLQPYLEVQ